MVSSPTSHAVNAFDVRAECLSRRRIRLRGLALVTAVVAVLLDLTVRMARATGSAWQVTLAPGPSRLEDVIGALAGSAALLLLGWLAVALLASAASAILPRSVPGVRPLACAVAPRLVRHGVAAVVGVAIVAAASPAGAASTGASGTGARTTVARTTVAAGLAAACAPGEAAEPTDATAVREPEDGPADARMAVREPERGPADARMAGWWPTGGDVGPGWQPTEPESRRSPRASADPSVVVQPRRRMSAGIDHEVVVRRGDTLWTLAARHLGPRATAAEIAVEWPRWFAANRAVLGRNPDHLTPGTRLQPPDAASTAHLDATVPATRDRHTVSGPRGGQP